MILRHMFTLVTPQMCQFCGIDGVVLAMAATECGDDRTSAKTRCR
jgi:hypothetical protein